ncbi:MAG TPA: carbamoyltransferase [Patescibacteria group bacterium]|nr:carbamoyltransferase [Patescibacteria group bacterium]
MYILGISCYYHDASATLIKDGQVVAAAEEERFTRKKHDSSFPINAVNFCLKYEGISIKEINHVGFYEKPILKFERILSQFIETFPWGLKSFISSMPSWINEKLRIIRIIKKKLGYQGEIFFIEHHLAHAASAYLLSPYDESSIVTIDGVGEWSTTAYGIGRNNTIELKKEIRFPDSLGLLYSTVTAYLGFRVNNSEYKVMGLSAYGRRDKSANPYYQKLKQVIDIKDDGSYKLDMSYFVFHYQNKMPSKKMCHLLGGPIRRSESELKARHKDVAAAIQLIYEETLFKILSHVHQQTKIDNLVLAGGCGLNSVANGKILKNTPFKNIWIQPNSSDGGASMGVASYVYHNILDHDKNSTLSNAYLGPEFSDQEIKTFLDNNKINYYEFTDRQKLIDKTAQLIYDNNVIGWFSGRMEWGPRALGARSILSNPTNKNMQEIINLKVKHREKFRPFAPVVCEDDASKYFDCDEPIPAPTDYMLMVYPIKEEYRSQLPAVTHVDGSGRLQTIRRGQNPLYYDLIKKFGELSGVPILINTSFNIRGEPIVCTPYDAYKCVMGTGIDYLIMGNFLIKRADNSQDKWDSEKYAKD